LNADMNAYTKPLPVITEQSKPFWDAAKAGQLLLPRCDHCGTFHTYFEPWCSHCGGEGVHWEALKGHGKIWANCRFNRVYFPGFEAELPYNVAIVELDEGPRLVTNIIGLATGALSEFPIGMEVDAVFDAVTDEVTLVKFQASSTQGRAR
jgi:uncharacterized OB-fold protein